MMRRLWLDFPEAEAQPPNKSYQVVSDVVPSLYLHRPAGDAASVVRVFGGRGPLT